MYKFTTIFIICLCFQLAYAQNGDKKHRGRQLPPIPAERIPPSPALTPQETLKTFKLHKDFEINVFASEPMIEKPISLYFDEFGRAWVAEMIDYMKDLDGTGEKDKQGRISCLIDLDGDGKADQSTIVLSGLENPRVAVTAVGGLIFSDGDALKWVKLNDLKPVGEVQILDPEYAEGGNIEHRPNGMYRAMDNRFYNAKSDRCYVFENGKWRWEKTSFRGQWGISQNNNGFLVSNHNASFVFLDKAFPELFSQHPAINSVKMPNISLQNERCYPGRINPGLNRAYISKSRGFDEDVLDADGKLIQPTGACAPYVYRGHQFPALYQDTYWMAESAGNFISAIAVENEQGQIRQAPLTPKSEFLTSASERFRPVALNDGPDGCLYVVDMSFGIIQHKHYMTSYLRDQYTSRGLDKPARGQGRIYRIRHRDTPVPPPTLPGKVDFEQLPQLLNHPSGWVRDRTQQLLVEAASTFPIESIRQAWKPDWTSYAEMHWLHTLEGLDAIDSLSLKKGLNSPHYMTRYHACLLAAKYPEQTDIDTLLKVQLPTPYRHALAIALLRHPSEKSRPALKSILNSKENIPMLYEALVTASKGHEAELHQAFLESSKTPQKSKVLLERVMAQHKIIAKPKLRGETYFSFQRGEALYENNCAACHGKDGEGMQASGPPLNNSEWVLEDSKVLASILLQGLSGTIRVDGEIYSPQQDMPALKENPEITDQDLADIATYLRNAWDNSAPLVDAQLFTKVRNSLENRENPFTPKELRPHAEIQTFLANSSPIDLSELKSSETFGGLGTKLGCILVAWLGICTLAFWLKFPEK